MLTATKIKATVMSTVGLEILACVQRKMTAFSNRLDRIPASIPSATGIPTDSATRCAICMRVAPIAMRIPNSFRLCDTVYEITLYKPMPDKSNAREASTESKYPPAEPEALRCEPLKAA